MHSLEFSFEDFDFWRGLLCAQALFERVAGRSTLKSRLSLIEATHFLADFCNTYHTSIHTVPIQRILLRISVRRPKLGPSFHFFAPRVSSAAKD